MTLTDRFVPPRGDRLLRGAEVRQTAAQPSRACTWCGRDHDGYTNARREPLCEDCYFELCDDDKDCAF